MPISASSSVTQAAIMQATQATQAVQRRDADGDNDGTQAASTPEKAPTLASSGSVGTQLHEVA